jgi:hypothetical protein
LFAFGVSPWEKHVPFRFNGLGLLAQNLSSGRTQPEVQDHDSKITYKKFFVVRTKVLTTNL